MPELLVSPLPDPDDPQRVFDVLDASDTLQHEDARSLEVPPELTIAESMVSATPMTTHPPKERSPLDAVLGSLGDAPPERRGHVQEPGLEGHETHEPHQHHKFQESHEPHAPELE